MKKITSFSFLFRFQLAEGITLPQSEQNKGRKRALHTALSLANDNKAHQNQQAPSHWPNSSSVWPPMSVWVDLAMLPPLCTQDEEPCAPPGSSFPPSYRAGWLLTLYFGQGAFCHGAEPIGMSPLWFLPLRNFHPRDSLWFRARSVKVLKTMWMFVCLCKERVELRPRCDLTDDKSVSSYRSMNNEWGQGY